MNAFADECRRRGAVVAGIRCKGSTPVSVRGGKTMVTDGPYVETHEHLGGAWFLDCADLDEALELAALCPMAAVGSIEQAPLQRALTWLTVAVAGCCEQ